MKAGDELTIDHEIITEGGQIVFTKGQKVIIREVCKYESRWSNVFHKWVEEKIWGIKLENHYGIMFLDCFEETINLK